MGEGEKFDESKIKDLTGGDTIPCRRMNEDFWELRPTHKLDLFGNHRPTVTGTDLGIWRRLRLIPWLVTVAPEDQDKQLAAKLIAELPGVLAWAIRGCLEWQRVGTFPSLAELTAYAADSYGIDHIETPGAL